MGWKEATKSLFENIDKLKGRACRAEYWWANLTWFLFVIAFSFFEIIILESVFNIYITDLINRGFTIFALLFFTGVSVRRMHDTNKSGIFFWLPLIVIFGSFILAFINTDAFYLGIIGGIVLGIVFFIFTLLPGDNGPNRYGEDPLEKSSSRTDTY
tara:strand:- start:160 stop:627 length:468 start_codon:yes stop_codon:yes gene_type:complete